MHGTMILAVMVRCAEINQFDGASLVYVNEQILGFEVSMRDILPVTKRDGLEDLLGHMRCFCLCKLFARCDFFEKFTAIAELRDQENVAFVLVHLIQPNNVRMVQILQYINFILHSNALLIIKLQFVNDFYRSLFSIRL